MLEDKRLDVAIVGAGPGGLSAAAAILTKCPDLKIRVFERESSLRRVGNFVFLSQNGQSALKALEPKVWERVKKDLNPIKETILSDFETEEVKEGFDNTTQTAAWYNLRQGLSDVLPKNSLKLGYKLQDLVQEDEGVVLNFSSPAESYHAKVVIGCDGYRSQVREICLQDGPPLFRNKICWRGVIEWPEYWPYTKAQELFMLKDGMGVVVAALDEHYLGWQTVIPKEEQSGHSFLSSGSLHLAARGEMQKRRCLNMVAEHVPEHVMKAIKDSPPESVTEHGLFARKPNSCGVWGKRSVTLLGDAAHMITPTLGQGVNQALIDAAELGRAIGELGPCEEALRQYESVRIDAVKPVQQASWDVEDGVIEEIEWFRLNPWCLSHVVEPL